MHQWGSNGGRCACACKRAHTCARSSAPTPPARPPSARLHVHTSPHPRPNPNHHARTHAPVEEGGKGAPGLDHDVRLSHRALQRVVVQDVREEVTGVEGVVQQPLCQGVMPSAPRAASRAALSGARSVLLNWSLLRRPTSSATLMSVAAASSRTPRKVCRSVLDRL